MCRLYPPTPEDVSKFRFHLQPLPISQNNGLCHFHLSWVFVKSIQILLTEKHYVERRRNCAKKTVAFLTNTGVCVCVCARACVVVCMYVSTYAKLCIFMYSCSYVCMYRVQMRIQNKLEENTCVRNQPQCV